MGSTIAYMLTTIPQIKSFKALSNVTSIFGEG